MLLKGASGGGGLAPPFLALGISSEEEDEERVAKIPDLDAPQPPSDDEGAYEPVSCFRCKWRVASSNINFLVSHSGSDLEI